MTRETITLAQNEQIVEERKPYIRQVEDATRTRVYVIDDIVTIIFSSERKRKENEGIGDDSEAYFATPSKHSSFIVEHKCVRADCKLYRRELLLAQEKMHNDMRGKQHRNVSYMTVHNF